MLEFEICLHETQTLTQQIKKCDTSEYIKKLYKGSVSLRYIEDGWKDVASLKKETQQRIN